jgi:hypothetical protein
MMSAAGFRHTGRALAVIAAYRRTAGDEPVDHGTAAQPSMKPRIAAVQVASTSGWAPFAQACQGADDDLAHAVAEVGRAGGSIVRSSSGV